MPSFFVPQVPDSLIYPHNLVLEIFGEYGVIGAAAIGFFLLWLFLPRLNRAADTTAALIAMYGLMISMTSGDLVHNRYFFVFAALHAAARIPFGEPKRESRVSRSEPVVTT